MDKKLKISFDFDGTLSVPMIQNLAKILIASGADVWIVTARFDNTFYSGNTKFVVNINSDVRYIADIVGIPHNKIIFTNGSLKRNTYFDEGFDIHFDDMWDEVEEINKCGGNAMLVDFSAPDIMLDGKFRLMYNQVINKIFK